jgi:hypothetical protein
MQDTEACHSEIMTSKDALALWVVAPSYWNQMVENSIPRRLTSGVTKVHNVGFKEIRLQSLPLHTKQSHIHCEEATDGAVNEFSYAQL